MQLYASIEVLNFQWYVLYKEIHAWFLRITIRGNNDTNNHMKASLFTLLNWYITYIGQPSVTLKTYTASFFKMYSASTEALNMFWNGWMTFLAGIRFQITKRYKRLGGTLTPTDVNCWRPLLWWQLWSNYHAFFVLFYQLHPSLKDV